MKFYCCAERENNPDTFSRVIMKVIDADYSHVFILVEDIPITTRLRLNLPLQGDIIYHATIPAYSRTTLEAETVKASVVEKIPIEVEDEMFALGWLEGNMGKEYSLAQCLVIPYPALVEKYENGEGKGFCSEFCIRFAAVNSVHADHFKSLNLEIVDPRVCIEILKKLL